MCQPWRWYSLWERDDNNWTNDNSGENDDREDNVTRDDGAGGIDSLGIPG